jgi:hypothetical protein
MKQYSKVAITRWKNNAAAALNLSFDDGYKETFKNCAHYLAGHKLSSTWNIPTALVGNTFEGRDIVSWSDIGEMSQQLGMEIASHSVNHLGLSTLYLHYLKQVPTEFYYASRKLGYLRQLFNTISGFLPLKRPAQDKTKPASPDIRYEVTASKSEIDKRLTPQVALSYVYPYGKFDRSYKDCVKASGYTSARSVYKGYNRYDGIDFFALRIMLWDAYTTVKQADGWIDKAMATGAWLIENYHLVAEDNRAAYRWFTPAGVFRQHVESLLSLAENNKVWVDTQQNIAQYMKQRLSSQATIVNQGPGSYILRLTNTQPQLSDQELTLRMEIPSLCNKIKVSQNNRPIPVNKEKDFILFSTQPNQGDILIKV